MTSPTDLVVLLSGQVRSFVDEPDQRVPDGTTLAVVAEGVVAEGAA